MAHLPDFILQNGLLNNIKSDKELLNYISNSHVNIIRKDIFDIVKLYADRLPVEQQCDIWSMLINGR